MKGKILCPAGCQNPVARITKAKEILKNPRPAGSWRPLKCIFSGKGKSRSQRAAKPRSGVILAKGKKAANVNHFFTLLGKMFFTSYGKEFFSYSGKQIFTS
ncbi:TPA: hypothetical protein KQG33_003081 [Clostridioides difficile]|nr:hypothetical protein [Clostridioides difficile]